MIINGNSLEELKKFPDNYFHSVVTDPPYGLSFMGKKWDYDVPSVEIWQEVFRVLKEGGYLLSFAGTRTQHRMAVNIEDAGFEIRDMIAWVYGSGFPKSHNIGKAVDKIEGNERETYLQPIAYPDSDCWGKPNSNSKGNDIGFESQGTGNRKDMDGKGNQIKTKGNSEWEGWGTALKPALEPITMARKPFKGTVANNVLKNGVGGINIDGCRVEANIKEFGAGGGFKIGSGKKENQNPSSYSIGAGKVKPMHQQGRFPANFIHDGSDEVTDLFPYTKNNARPNQKPTYNKNSHSVFGNKHRDPTKMHNDSGSASRFFYCAKASKQDRNEGLEDFEDKKLENHSATFKVRIENGVATNTRTDTERKNNHPTVKPTNLMRYLVRLVTPKDGIVLDCFMGSGSTGKACALEGFEFVGIDLDKDYCEIAKARIDKAIEDKKQAEAQKELF